MSERSATDPDARHAEKMKKKKAVKGKMLAAKTDDKGLLIDEVIDFLKARTPPDKQMVITGRNAKPELIEIADLVTAMTLIKHPFRAGVKTQKGVGF